MTLNLFLVASSLCEWAVLSNVLDTAALSSVVLLITSLFIWRILDVTLAYLECEILKDRILSV